MTDRSRGSLTLHLTDRPTREVGALDAVHGRRVVAGQLARMDALRSAGGMVGADRSLVTIGDLFALTADALAPDLRPAPASHRLVRHAALQRYLSDPDVELCDELRSCRERGADRDALLSWIDRISTRADRDHTAAATTDVEHGIERLRAALAEDELHSDAQRRALIARAAAQVKLGGALVADPQPLGEPYVSGLLKGLAVGQRVTVVGYTTRALVDHWLTHARMQDHATSAHEGIWGREDSVGALFGADAASGNIEWCEAPNQYTEALARVAALIDTGIDPSDITLVLARPATELFAFEQAAERAGVPFLGRLPVRWQHTPLGRFAHAACVPEVTADDLRHAGAHLGCTGEDVERIVAARGPERVAALVDVLEVRAGRAGVPDEALARELLWLDALTTELDVAAELERPPRARDIVEGAVVAPVVVGDPDGVAVVDYPEAQTLRRRHLVATGLSDGEWPPATHPSPFISEATLRACPGLAAPDRRVDFAAACVAHDHVTLLREGLNGAGRRRARSVLFAAAVDAGARSTAPQATPADVPVAPIPTAPAPAVTSTRAGRKRFSISELNQYLDCPLGWLVRYGLGAGGESTELQELGEVNHRMLEAAFGVPDTSVSDRIERARQAARDAGLDEVAVEVNLLHVQRVIETYSPPAWPGVPIHVEYRCERISANGTTIVGRVDRIDRLPDGRLLLIDYKRHARAFYMTDAMFDRQLQATAYPQMVAKELGVDVVGMLFVSINDPSHNGVLATRFPSVDLEQVNIRSDLFKAAAKRAMSAAITGIRSDTQPERGPGCWDRCPCHGYRGARAR